MKRCHGRLHYDRKFQIFIFLIGYVKVNQGVFCLIISYLRIKSYNVLNYNNCSTDWSFPLREIFLLSFIVSEKNKNKQRWPLHSCILFENQRTIHRERIFYDRMTNFIPSKRLDATNDFIILHCI